MNRTVMAVAAHPDDIEFMMAGTLILLKKAGWDVHYMNVANGSCGSMTMTKEQTIEVRTQEAKNAASLIGAAFHPPIVDDIDIFYEPSLIRKLCGIVREVKPQILLLQSPQDYMEDHMISSRLMVTAAFCRNMKNYETDPPTGIVDNEMCIYHALPWGLMDQLRNPVRSDFYVDISSMMDTKRDMLSCHKSQKDWLDASQGLDSYLKTMEEMSFKVGKMCGKIAYAEGWRRHSHLGFGPEEMNLLTDALSDYVITSEKGEL